MLAVRLAPIRHEDNLKAEKGAKMDYTTTNRTDFKGARATPAKPIRPKGKGQTAKEPFVGLTEHREEFTAKPHQPVKTFKLKDNDFLSGPFEGKSNYSDDFLVHPGAQKAKSYAPANEYIQQKDKFGNLTTSQSDFIAYRDVQKVPYAKQGMREPWHRPDEQMVTDSTYKVDFPPAVGSPPERFQFQPRNSTVKLGKEASQHSTNYGDEFRIKQIEKPKSFAPAPLYVKAPAKMQSSTEMQDKFQGVFLPPPKSFRPKVELDSQRPAMETLTVYQESFKRFSFVPEEQNSAAEFKDPNDAGETDEKTR